MITIITGAIPTIEPETAEELAAALRRASDARQSVVIRGAGTKIDWGRPPRHVDTFVATRRLNRVLAHQHGDLTATIEAGATLREVNDALARHGQWLPLDPPFADRATIGGILATNDSGPLRHRFGTPRDLVIGVRLATTDGTLAKAGGQVVKNVAGYDLSKLICGSFGSLAAIVSATFKLAPRAAGSKTLIVDVPDVDALAQIVRDVMSSQLEPIAFEVLASSSDQREALAGRRVMLRFASLPAVVDVQIDQARELPAIRECTTRLVDGDDERRTWADHSRRLWDAPGAVVRASWLPADIATIIGRLKSEVTSEAKSEAKSEVTSEAKSEAKSEVTSEVELGARAAVGAGLIRIGGDARAQARAIEELRRSTTFRHVVIVRGGDELKSLVDVWGPPGDRDKLFAPLKHALDPHGTLNAGRGPL